MPKLVIPDLDEATLERLRERANHHAQSVEGKAKAILAGACRRLAPPIPGRPSTPCETTWPDPAKNFPIAPRCVRRGPRPMSVFVVDVSVVMKWMLPEPLSTEAVRLQSPSHQLHAPSFFGIELANVLWKKVRQRLLSRARRTSSSTICPACRLLDTPTLRWLPLRSTLLTARVARSTTACISPWRCGWADKWRLRTSGS